MRGVRIRTNDKLARKRIALGDNGVADAFRTFAVAQLAVQLDATRFREVFLLQLQLRGQVEQAHLALLFRQYFVEERKVIAEEQDRDSVVDRLVFAEIALVENCGHRRDVLMTETQVGARESSVSRFHRVDAHMVRTVHHVARENLFRNHHRPRPGRYRRQKYLALKPRHVEGKQPAILNNLARNFVLALGEFAQVDFLTVPDLIDQAEIGCGQQSQVLAVLFIDSLDILGDHQVNPGCHLGVRRLFAARSFATALAADAAHKSATLHVAPLDWGSAAALQSRVREFSQSLVEEEADMRRRDFVGRNIIAQLGITLRMLRVPRQVFSRQLTLDEFRIFGEEKDAPLQTYAVRTLGHGAMQQRRNHRKILSQIQFHKHRGGTADYSCMGTAPFLTSPNTALATRSITCDTASISFIASCVE